MTHDKRQEDLPLPPEEKKPFPHHEKRMEALSVTLSMRIDEELFRAVYDCQEYGMYIDRQTNFGWVPLQENDDWKWLFKYMRECFANLGLK